LFSLKDLIVYVKKWCIVFKKGIFRIECVYVNDEGLIAPSYNGENIQVKTGFLKHRCISFNVGEHFRLSFNRAKNFYLYHNKEESSEQNRSPLKDLQASTEKGWWS